MTCIIKPYSNNDITWKYKSLVIWAGNDDNTEDLNYHKILRQKKRQWYMNKYIVRKI